MCPGGALHMFRVRGHAIGKGIYFPYVCMKIGINFHNFVIRNGTYFFQDFYMKYITSDILFRKTGIRSGILFQKLGIRNGYVFEASMACPQPKSGQVHPQALCSYKNNSNQVLARLLQEIWYLFFLDYRQSKISSRVLSSPLISMKLFTFLILCLLFIDIQKRARQNVLE